MFDPVPRCATELLLANILDRSHFHGESPTDEKKLYTSAHIQANNLTWIDIPVSLTEDLEWGVGKDYEWIVVQELSMYSLLCQYERTSLKSEDLLLPLITDPSVARARAERRSDACLIATCSIE